MAYPGFPSPMEGERRKQIDRTKTGLLLLLIGTLIGFIPFIGIVGGLLILIGAILVILGRKAFGATHARNVILALVLFLVGLLGAVALGVIFAVSLFGGVGQTPADFARALGSALNTLFIGIIVLTVITGIGSVLFTYALQQQNGKILLWAGYGASIAVQIAIFAIIGPLINAAVADAIARGTTDPATFVALQNQANTLNLLNGIPSVLFAAATYLAWSRVNRGEIPPPTMAPAGMPATWPPAPPTGPAPPINPR